MYLKDYDKYGRHRRPIPRWIKIVIGITLVSLCVSICTGYILSHTKEVRLHGIVKSHHVTHDNVGDPKYYTIIELENGTIVTKQGLNYYILKEGESVVVKETVFE